ncbi:uncharacterized protein [Palaemon carinicauda]|uniref:uncharacterized protein n=1 Tax=Palaemon carinicauda TaxID=392227 RepID=UPI0035B67EF1
MGGIRDSSPVSGELMWTVTLLCIVFVASAKVIQPKTGLESSPLTVVYGLESGEVLLPCDVSPPVTSDDTILVLFYRGSIGTPIYSIDGRTENFREAEHWSYDEALGNRAFLNMSLRPPGLVIKPLYESDKDEYRCRVDYRSSPTRNVRIDLKVIGFRSPLRRPSSSPRETMSQLGLSLASCNLPSPQAPPWGVPLNIRNIISGYIVYAPAHCTLMDCHYETRPKQKVKKKMAHEKRTAALLKVHFYSDGGRNCRQLKNVNG